MIAWINFAVLVVASFLIVYCYWKSVRPATLEKQIGERAYAVSAWWRKVASVFMFMVLANAVVYLFYPLPLPIPQWFPWSYWISAGIALVIGAPSVYLMWRGMKDAGEETMTPKKEHTLYRGIYQYIRHPQGVGEGILWVVLMLLFHSPFLVLYGIVVLLPIELWICLLEEPDLVVRYGADYEAYRQHTGAFFPKRHLR